MNWKVGDRAVILYSPGGKSIGHITQILSQLRPASNDATSGEIKAGDMVYEIDGVAANGAPICVSKPEWLGPIPDDFTRFHEALISSKWSDCEWTPFVTVEGDNDLP